MPGFGITLFTKTDGPLTKRLELVGDKVLPDTSCCAMTRGTAERWPLNNIGDLAEDITKFRSKNALALGSLRYDLPDEVEIVTKGCLNGNPHVIARTVENIIFRPGKSALTLLDFDTKGMPGSVAERISELGGFEDALLSVLPGLAGCAHLLRASTSAGLFREDTGQDLPGSNGMHVLALLADGADNERFLRTLHVRCWLVGLGWGMVGTAGQFLERSIVDRMVGSPERLVFEGPPVLEPPLKQRAEARRPIIMDGIPLNSLGACPPLSIAERGRLEEMRARAECELEGDLGRARAAFIERQAERLAKRTGCSKASARQTIAHQTRGVLLPDIILPFDDDELEGTTVAEVIADPNRYVGETLADPLEGTTYGAGKAKIMRRGDGSLWVHSFAHGRAVYELRYDAAAIKAAIKQAPADEAAHVFVQLALVGELDQAEIDALIDTVHDRSGIGKRAIGQMLRQVRHGEKVNRMKAAEKQRLAERDDPRTRLDEPMDDDEWEPLVGSLNEIWDEKGLI